ncbi:hypothetical protein [Rubrimonas cliftonensis]|uniref:Uncharacterized protein n=1 Tax=Rubrimonas cliftonensis TaxID=89524 RepID=A0A1H4EAG9_9RHOB|nr:hypothetical protein [Rubrimonas cliftonensis]SEA82043.1 hypothetical protein SAMN05444370_1132 [Rubrimonas cliftonensis]
MLDLNTVIRSLDEEVAEETRNDIVEALATACAGAVAEAMDTAYCSPAVWDGMRLWLVNNLNSDCEDERYGLPAMTSLLETLARACVEGFSYSALPNDQWYPGAPVDLDMHDRGGAIMHRRAYNCAAVLCMVAHGEQGATIVKGFDDLQDRNLRKMAELIGKRLGEKLRGR